MGVAGLWEVLRSAGQVRSLTELAVEDGFNANTCHQRGFRIGIDASIWFFHAAYGKEGENPELPVKRGKRVGGNVHWLTQGMKNIIDAFGFEWWVAPGEAEAELAYLNRIGVIDAVLSDDVDNFLFGATMVIRNPSNTLSGNRAHPVKNAQGKDDGNHVVTYAADAILSDPSVALSRAGTILIGLLSGGDYIPAGLPGCGQKFATGLARAGFGDSLLKAVKEYKGAKMDAFLDQWRQDIRNELRTNKSGLLPSKKPSLAASLPDDFPSLPVLMSYADPITTENLPQKSQRKNPPGVWRNDPDPMRIASLCELYFEWGVKDVIVQRFRTVLWPGIVCRAIRRAVMDGDTCRRPLLANVCHRDSEGDDTTAPSSPTKRISSSLAALALSSPSKKSSSAPDPPPSESFVLSSLVTLVGPASPSSSRPTSPSLHSSSTSPLLVEVLSQRAHVSTDATLEYRVLVNPTALVERAESGVKGLRPPLIGGLFGEDDEDSGHGQDADDSDSEDDIARLETAAGAAAKSGVKKRKARRVVPTTLLRLWMPACMVCAVAPALVASYEEKARVREEKKAKRGTRGGRGGRAGTGVKSTSRRTHGGDDDDETVPGPSATRTAAVPKAKPKIVRAGGRRRKPKQAAEAQDEAYECFDLSAGESLCSSNGEGVQGNAKGKMKVDMGRPTTKASAKVGVANRKMAGTSTMKEFFNTTKPSTVKSTKPKPFPSRPPAAKSSMDTVAPKHIHHRKGEEESTDVDTPIPLPKSSRPLDVLRAKSRSGTILPGPGPKSNPTVVPLYEEEPSSGSPQPRPSGSKSSASSLSCQPAQPAPQARKKPLFVDVSDTDSDIEVSDVRHPTTANLVARDKVNGGAGTLKPRKTSRKVADGVIDPMAKGNSSRPKSTPSTTAPTASLPLERALSVPLASGSSSGPVSGTVAGTIDSTSISRPPSKLTHILFSKSSLESDEDQGSEGSELPTFHRGAAKSRSKKTTIATNVLPGPRPFPMRFALGSPVSPNTPRRESRHNEHDDGDAVEIIDVFTTPRGPSPPRSPTPSPSPAKSQSVLTSAGCITHGKSKLSDGFPTSPASQTGYGSHEQRKPRRRTSSSEEIRESENARNGIAKSPRKSAAHSSPRHVSRAPERASSPTPRPLSSPRADSAVLWTGMEAPDSGRLQYGSTQMGNGTRRSRPSDMSAISISSESEDDEDQRQSCRKAEVEMDGDEGEGTDVDVDGWVDTAMILSAPPSPVSPTPVSVGSDPVPLRGVPGAEALLHPRVSKFKPATTALKVDTRAPLAERRAASAGLEGTTQGKDTTVARPTLRAPLLVARAKRNKGRDDDVIDLTSD